MLGLVAGTAAFASYDKAVQLTVDGKTRTVHAWGSSVADVLASEKLTITGHDLVSPAPTAKVEDGTDVVVRYGRKLKVTIDGQPREYWTTALTVDEGLQQIGLRSEPAQLSVSRSQPLGREGLALALNTQKKVSLTVAGKTTPVTTYSGTIAELLKEKNLTVAKLDRLTPAATAPLADGAKITLDRITQRTVTETISVDFTTTSTKTDSLDKGDTKVVTQGKAGSAKVTYLDTYTNAKLTTRKTVTTDTLTKPVTQVEQEGTREPEVSVPSASQGADGLNWASLAECESGGNPRAVNPNGHYGLYQFSLSTWGSVGGSGNPIDASASEQTARAKALYDKAGAGQWSCGSHLYD
ncbi:MAG: ubiquitin-like domain-containing protein [Angustibacter sp.]